ncbi:hypothetical protein HPB51_022247 [Rhipicephalus microplus]|uniref:CCHC-type domain-containing protein n=1 Tax=Rhipicephalus microplus TaxID=6941 RepID=A0A9J6DQP2_RHIMP|nr:hypothetical protein HPB51_022247 [Rhipicephalus microplus]
MLVAAPASPCKEMWSDVARKSDSATIQCHSAMSVTPKVAETDTARGYPLLPITAVASTRAPAVTVFAQVKRHPVRAPALVGGPHCGDATAMEVTVEGTEITPEEFRTADWITKVGKHVKELRDSARGDRQGRQDGNARAESGADPGEDRKKTAAANAAYKKLVHKIAERSIASYLPRLPANDYKIIIRPKCGLALTKVSNTRLREAVRMAAQIPWIKGQEKEVLIVNDKQGTLIFSTPGMDTVWKVTRIKSIKIEGKNYDVMAYLAPHEDSGRGVVRGIDPRLSVEELTEAFGNSRNPPILGVRKLRNSCSAVIIFKNETVPRWMYCYGVPLKCVLYKKRYEVCYRCGQLGHRSYVCISDHVHCRGCGMTAPPEDHACEPKCKLCGKGHCDKISLPFRHPGASLLQGNKYGAHDQPVSVEPANRPAWLRTIRLSQSSESRSEMRGSFQDPLYNKEETVGCLAVNGRRRAEGERRRSTNVQNGRDQRTVQESVEASERVKRKSRFLPKTTGKTRRRAATND